MATLTRKEKADGWPEKLRIPTVEEFRHGSWIVPGNMLYDMMRGQWPSRRQLAIPRDNICGTQCCLVGWMGIAFNGPIRPGDGGHFTEAHRKFALTILRLCGVQMPERCSLHTILYKCSDVFEWDGIRGEPKFKRPNGLVRGLSPERARQLWLDAAEHHGYDVSAFR